MYIGYIYIHTYTPGNTQKPPRATEEEEKCISDIYTYIHAGNTEKPPRATEEEEEECISAVYIPTRRVIHKNLQELQKKKENVYRLYIYTYIHAGNPHNKTRATEEEAEEEREKKQKAYFQFQASWPKWGELILDVPNGQGRSVKVGGVGGWGGGIHGHPGCEVPDNTNIPVTRAFSPILTACLCLCLGVPVYCC